MWDQLAPLVAQVPPEGDECWEYDATVPNEAGVRSSRKLDAFPSAVADAYRFIAEPKSCPRWMSILGYPVSSDDSMHECGVRVLSPGGFSDCRLNYSQHPHKRGQVKCLTVVAFLHNHWVAEWGGELYLATPDGEARVAITPRSGRVVAFEDTDLSYHGVAPISPYANDRISVVASFLATGTNTRERALFLSRREFEWPASVARI